MSRFVDRSAVERLDLGNGDWVDLRKALSGTEWATVFQGDTDRSLVIFIAGWNLKDADGEDAPVDVASVSSLDAETFRLIDGWIGANITPPTLPNRSSGPSRRGTRGPRSRTQVTPPNGSSTTPSWQPAGTSATSTTPAPSS